MGRRGPERPVRRRARSFKASQETRTVTRQSSLPAETSSSQARGRREPSQRRLQIKETRQKREQSSSPDAITGWVPADDLLDNLHNHLEGIANGTLIPGFPGKSEKRKFIDRLKDILENDDTKATVINLVIRSCALEDWCEVIIDPNRAGGHG